MRPLLLGLTFAAFLGFVAPAVAQTPAAPKSAFTDAQKAELNSVIRQYIVDNPQALISSVESFYAKQNADKEKQEGRLEKAPQGLTDNALTPFVGPKDAPFTIVYFFDYNCGFCKQVESDLSRVIDEEKNIKFIFKELPILSANSEILARYAIASNKQGKYLAFHTALMQHEGSFNDASIDQIAKDVGLDVAKLKIDAGAQDLRDLLQANVAQAREVGVRGTPFFLVGKEKIPGAVGYSKLKEVIQKERDGVSTPRAAIEAAVNATQKPIPPRSEDALDPEVQREFDKAQAETKAMLDAVNKEAAAAVEAAKK